MASDHDSPAGDGGGVSRGSTGGKPWAQPSTVCREAVRIRTRFRVGSTNLGWLLQVRMHGGIGGKDSFTYIKIL